MGAQGQDQIGNNLSGRQGATASTKLQLTLSGGLCSNLGGQKSYVVGWPWYYSYVNNVAVSCKESAFKTNKEK